MHAMATRIQRRQRILEILTEYPIRSQQMLCSRLALEGITVTQATLSRDLNEMGVLKGPDRYLAPGGERGTPADRRLVERTLEKSLLAIDTAGAIVVLRTPPGHADALAIELDRARTSDVVGTIAGDDTIFIAVRDRTRAKALVARLTRMANRR